MPKRWTTPPATPLPPQAAQWADALSISPFLAQLLWQRGLDSAEAMDLFLNPGLSRLPQPTELPGLDQAAGHLAASLGSNARIAVWGDYDVDGVTSSALLLDFFQQRGIEAQAYLPHRSEEGYGLNIPGIELLAKQGVGLLLTVDCGVSDIEPIARARELGMDVIVTDHHLPGDQAPDVCAMVNPKLGPCNVPGLTDLAGVGVAFYLAAALNRRLPGEPLDMREFLDLVALGSLADVVPLTNVNRILVKNGLLKISEAKRPGIAALKEVAGFTAGADLNSTQVVFGLGPRINAAGRLDDARSALDLLLSPDMVTARPYAENLNQMNKARRKIEDEIHSEALEQAQNILTDDSRAGLVLYAPHWRSGVVGIVASRVVEAMYRPTLILCDDNGFIKGSGRSIPECNIHQAITQCADLCAHFGGHHQAAGLTLADPDHLAPLMDRFNQAVIDQIGADPLTPSLAVDQELGFESIDFTLLKELELLHPFGPANPEPIFFSRPLTLRAIRHFGKNRAHASLELRDETAGVTLKGKAWRKASELPKTMQGSRIEIAFSPTIDRYNGLARVDLEIKDWRNVTG